MNSSTSNNTHRLSRTTTALYYRTWTKIHSSPPGERPSHLLTPTAGPGRTAVVVAMPTGKT